MTGTLHAQVMRAGQDLDGKTAVRAGLRVGRGAVSNPDVNQGAAERLPRAARKYLAGEFHERGAPRAAHLGSVVGPPPRLHTPGIVRRKRGSPVGQTPVGRVAAVEGKSREQSKQER